MPNIMKAVRFHRVGGPEVLVYEDAARPTPTRSDVLVRVHATGVNPLDWKIRSGQLPLIQDPFPKILGCDVSGVVESVGSGVTNLAPGDEVFGLLELTRNGAYAEYVAGAANVLAKKPAHLDFITAAAMPAAALTPWQGLFDHGHLEAGQSALIHGAAGGLGSFAVQFAKAHGAKVIGTASGRNREFVLSLGADEVIDYTAERFEDRLKDIDLVFDTIGGDTQRRSFQVIRPGGRLVTVMEAAGPAPAGIELKAFNVRSNPEQLLKIADLVKAGKVKVSVEQVFPLEQARQAHTLSESGHARGKIVLQVV